jgi:hypothetical protein
MGHASRPSVEAPREDARRKEVLVPDENGVCRCGGAGWDGCKPAKEAAAPSPEAQLATRLDEAVQSLPTPLFQQAVEAAISTPRRPALSQATERGGLPEPTPFDTISNFIPTERETEHTRRSRRDG